MLKAIMRARTRARLREDERGFTIIETMIAITVIFSSLTALAYTATAGFGYQDAARQRQTANSVASQLMERVRGLTTTQITMGLLSTDLTDSRIVSGNFRPVTGCTTTPAGCGETVVNSPGQSSFPLNKHLWCTSTSQTLTINNVAYSCGIYVTQNTSVSNAPYRITIIVTWTGGASGANKIVRLQSLFASAPGCSSSTNHPYPGPCQGFFSLQATEPTVNINITGTTPAGIAAFTAADLFSPGVTASEQTEQSTNLSATLRTAGGTMTGASTPSAGIATVNAAADDSPDTSTAVDSGRRRCGTEVTCTVATSPSLSSGSNSIGLSLPATTGESDDTTTVGATGITSICPLPPVTADTDRLPCAGATGSAGDMSASLTLNGTTPPFGAITLAKMANPATATVYVDRQFTTGYRCTSPSATIGCVGGSASRSLGTVTIGGLPVSVAGWSPPVGWAGFLTLTSYSDSVAASVGSGATTSVPTIGGTLKCWHDTGTPGYSSFSPLTSATLNIDPSTSPCKHTEQIGSGTNKVTITITLDSATAGSVSPASATTGTLTSAVAQVVGPTVKVLYAVDGSGTANDANFTITMTLGTAKVQGTFVAAPAGP